MSLEKAPAAFTLDVAAAKTGISIRRLRYAVRTGEVKGSRPFGRYLILADEVERLLSVKPPPATSVRP
jgi:hypothetical protein